MEYFSKSNKESDEFRALCNKHIMVHENIEKKCLDEIKNLFYGDSTLTILGLNDNMKQNEPELYNMFA